MAEQVLCDDVFRVSLNGEENRACLTIFDETSSSFWTDLSILDEALEGVPIQISAPGSYCRIEATGDIVRLDFAIENSPRRFCTFPREVLAEALVRLRER